MLLSFCSEDLGVLQADTPPRQPSRMSKQWEITGGQSREPSVDGGQEAKMSGRDGFLFVSSNQRLSSEDNEKSGKNNDVMPDQGAAGGDSRSQPVAPNGPDSQATAISREMTELRATTSDAEQLTAPAIVS